MGHNPKKHYTTAIYDVTGDDSGAAATTHTPGTTSLIPDNAVITDVTVYCETAFAGSSGTLTINAGGVDCTAAIGVATLAEESVTIDTTGGKATSNAAIKCKTHGSNAFTGGKAHITVGYLLGFAE